MDDSMTSEVFEPKPFINCEAEQERFEKLLEQKSEQRILTIEATWGMGKTWLLQKLRAKATYNDVPSCFLKLQQPIVNEFDLISKIKKDITPPLSFPNFTKIDGYIKSSNWKKICKSPFTDVDPEESTKKTFTFNGPVHNPLFINQNQNPELTPHQKLVALEGSLNAFLYDLREACAEKTVILLFDDYEKCDPNLKKWFVREFLAKQFFDIVNRPRQLYVVIGGREVPNLKIFGKKFDLVVAPVAEFSYWTKEHVDEWIRVNGFSVPEEGKKQIYDLVKLTMPALALIDAIDKSQKR